MSEVSVKQAPKKIQNLYFQFVLVQLLPYRVEFKEGEEIKLSINRGKQMFEQTKNIKVNYLDGSISLNRAKLNFIVFTYDPIKIYEFSLKISRVILLQQTPIAEYFFDCNSYIDLYLQLSNGAFQDEFKVGKDLQVKVQIYVEKSRYGLERLVREMNNAKSKVLEHLGNRAFQRINERKVKTNERSVSPRKKRETPSMRNSPIKERPKLSFTMPKVATKQVLTAKTQEIGKETKQPQNSHEIIQFVQKPQKLEKEDVPIAKQEENEAIITKEEVPPIPPSQNIEIKKEVAKLVPQQRQQTKVQDILTQQMPKQTQVLQQLTKEEPVNVTWQNAVPTNEASSAQQHEKIPLKLRQFPLKFKIAFFIFIFFFLIVSNFIESRSSPKKISTKGNLTSINTTAKSIKSNKQPTIASKKKSTR